MSSLVRRHGRMKTCVRPSGQKWFSVSFSGLNYLRPTYCKKCSQEVFPQLKSFGFMVIWSQNSKICKKGPKAKKLRPNILDAKFGWNLAKKPGSSSWFSARSPKRGLKFEIRIKKLPRLWLSSFASDRGYRKEEPGRGRVAGILRRRQR